MNNKKIRIAGMYLDLISDVITTLGVKIENNTFYEIGSYSIKKDKFLKIKEHLKKANFQYIFYDYLSVPKYIINNLYSTGIKFIPVRGDNQGLLQMKDTISTLVDNRKIRFSINSMASKQWNDFHIATNNESGEQYIVIGDKYHTPTISSSHSLCYVFAVFGYTTKLKN